MINIANLAADKREPGNFAGQSAEVLVGINFSFANQLAEYGLPAEAAHVLEVMHDLLYGRREMWYRTPAALETDAPVFRAVLNLRPLAIWGQECAASGQVSLVRRR